MALYVDPNIPRFTRDELVAEMAARFGDFSDGAFRRWQEQGLVASPRAAGRWIQGESGTRKGLWSDHDRRMLIALLEKRDEHRRQGTGQLQVAELANLVVWSWLFWDGFVSLDQAQRALRTWVAPQVGGAHGAARSRRRLVDHALAAIAALAAPGVPRRQQRMLASKIAEMLWADDLDGLEVLIPDLAAVIDPAGTGRGVGAPGARTDAPGEVERIRLTHLGARAVIMRQPGLDDTDWFAARQVVRRSWLDYEREWSSLRANASTPGAFTPPTPGMQISLASRTLLYTLGHRLVDRQRNVVGAEALAPILHENCGGRGWGLADAVCA